MYVGVEARNLTFSHRYLHKWKHRSNHISSYVRTYSIYYSKCIHKGMIEHACMQCCWNDYIIHIPLRLHATLSHAESGLNQLGEQVRGTVGLRVVYIRMCY